MCGWRRRFSSIVCAGNGRQMSLIHQNLLLLVRHISHQSPRACDFRVPIVEWDASSPTDDVVLLVLDMAIYESRVCSSASETDWSSSSDAAVTIQVAPISSLHYFTSRRVRATSCCGVRGISAGQCIFTLRWRYSTIAVALAMTRLKASPHWRV